MDPKTRRVLWNCLNNIKNKGKSLVLTTHSMDETEALCSNIGIMVNGELKCFLVGFSGKIIFWAFLPRKNLLCQFWDLTAGPWI